MFSRKNPPTMNMAMENPKFTLISQLETFINVDKTMPFAPSPSHHHFLFGGGINLPFPVMGGKHDIVLPTLVHIFRGFSHGFPMVFHPPIPSWRGQLSLTSSVMLMVASILVAAFNSQVLVDHLQEIGSDRGSFFWSWDETWRLVYRWLL